MNKLLTSLLVVLFSLPVSSQKLKKVEGEYTYYVPEHVSQAQAKQTALERAMIQALADAFGTIVSQTDATRVSNQNGQSSMDFLSIGSSEVKGEWIETIGEPVYSYDNIDGMQVIHVSVKGRAREVLSAAIDVQAKLLRNGKEDKYEADVFKLNDDICLAFQSPVNGYLAVYLVDDDRNVFCLVPNEDSTEGICTVEANQRYTFLDELYITCSQPEEHNQIYVIFSPNHFVKAVDDKTAGNLPRELPFKDFQKWLVKCRKHDVNMTLKMMPITILGQ